MSDPSKLNHAAVSNTDSWRYAVLFATVAGTLILIMLQPAMPQDVTYHAFADARSYIGIPNFFDVTSNLPFLIVGAAGVMHCRSGDVAGYRPGWLTLFAGVAMISLGSGYYHLSPDNRTLVWDRLPMTIGFMGLFVALLSDYLRPRIGRTLLLPALLTGMFSVFYWHFTDDLRLYYWVQFMPLLTVLVVVFLFRPSYSRQWMLIASLGFYMLGKFAELYDREIFAFLQGSVSGHTLKHLLSAAGCLTLLLMLVNREPVSGARAFLPDRSVRSPRS